MSQITPSSGTLDGRGSVGVTPRPVAHGFTLLWRELVGAELRRLRRARGERLVDVAARAGVSVQYLSEVERGQKEPSSEVLEAVCAAFGLTVLDLAGRVVAGAQVLETTSSLSLVGGTGLASRTGHAELSSSVASTLTAGPVLLAA